MTADEKQSPAGVGVRSERIASAIETAVEAADDRPHFLINAPPRVATHGVNSSVNHFSSEMTALAFWPEILALTQSGTCVVKWNK